MLVNHRRAVPHGSAMEGRPHTPCLSLSNFDILLLLIMLYVLTVYGCLAMCGLFMQLLNDASQFVGPVFLNLLLKVIAVSVCSSVASC
jgi:hypothetical protein